jgi:heptosyltransferase-2
MWHTDCRHFRTSHPCAPHKLTRARCGGCASYDPLGERILIVKLGSLGDVLRTTSCLAPLKARYPRGHVTWVTRPDARPLLARNPAVDRVLTTDGNYLELLLAEEFDLALGPETDLLSASIMRLARAGERRGFAADGRGGVVALGDAAAAWWHTGLDDAAKQGNRRTYGSWLYDVFGLAGPVAPPTLAVPDAARARAAERLAAGAGWARRYVCVNTGASSRWKEKRWKLAHYRDFVRLLGREEPGAAVVLVGGPEEADFNRELVGAGLGVVDGGTANSVEEFGALVAACDWVLTPDSLGYHVACATHTPAACLVGPTAPWELDRYARNLVLHSDLPCIACYHPTCPLPRTCMDALTPGTVWEEVRRWRAGDGAEPVVAAPVAAAPAAADPAGAPHAGADHPRAAPRG